MLFNRQAGPLRRSVRIAGGSGLRSRRDSQVKMRYLSRECRPPWGHVGSGRRAACHQRGLHHHRSRLRGATCCSRIARRSRCCGPKGMACGRSPAGWSGPPRPSPGNCGGMPPPAAAVWTTGRRPHSGTPTARRAVQSRSSWRPTRRCGSTSRIVWPARSSPRTGRRLTGRP
jgi:hypothetical protein